jgi:hypothetical protein
MQITLILAIALVECVYVLASSSYGYSHRRPEKYEKNYVKKEYKRDKDAYEFNDKPKRSKSYNGDNNRRPYEEIESKDDKYEYNRHNKNNIICVPLTTASKYKLSKNEECAPYTLNIDETYQSISGENTTQFLALVALNPDVDFEKASNGTTICVPSLKYKYKLSGPCLSYIVQKGETFKTLSDENLNLEIDLRNANPSNFVGFSAYSKEKKEKDDGDYKKRYKNEEMKNSYDEDNDKRRKDNFICIPLSTASKYKLSENEECAPYTLNIDETFETISQFNTTLFLELVELNPYIDHDKATNGTTICVPSLKYKYKLSGPCLAYKLQKGETLKSLSDGNISLYINLKNANPSGYNHRKSYVKEETARESTLVMPYD